MIISFGISSIEVDCCKIPKCCIERIGTVESQDEIKQATATTKFVTKFLNSGEMLEVNIDHVPAIKALFWPKSAQAWTARNKPWPGKHVREAISKEGCHVIPKPSSSNGSRDENLEWRYSFSNAESYLMKLLTQNQKRAYFLFKAIFYKYIKPINGLSPSGERKEIFFSYLVKTTMFHVCEERSIDDPLWGERNILNCVAFLLQKLEHFLSMKHLPHFFINETNLILDIAHYSAESLPVAISKLNLIVGNVIFYVPFNLPDVKTRGQKLMDIMLLLKIVVNCIGKGDIDRTLRTMRPFLQ